MADYYVNGAGGDGDGSWGTPWNNINGHVDDLVAGDTMHVRVGTYNEVKIRPTVSGASGSRIVLKAYDDEAVILQCSVAGDPVLEFDDVSWWTVEDMDVDKEDNGEVDVLMENGAHHITLRDCDIHNAAHFALIYIDDGDDTLIEGCTIYDNNAGAHTDAHGILMQEGVDVTIAGCTIYDCRGDGFQLEWLVGIGDTGDRLLIANNTFYVDPAIAGCCEGAIDIKTGPTNWADHVVIRGNTMYNFRPCDGSCGGTSNMPGDAIKVHSHGKNVWIRRNEIYNCTSGMFLVYPDGEVRITENIVRDLVSSEDIGYESAINVYGASDVKIYNNTFYECPERLWGFEDSTVEIKNNLCHETHSIADMGGNTLDYDYNGWYTCVDTLAGGNDISGVDPDFVDEGNKDLRLNATSPAVDAGVNMGLGYFGTDPDIGRWERQGADTTVKVCVVVTVIAVV